MNIGQKKRSRDEVIALLKERLAPLRFDKESKKAK